MKIIELTKGQVTIVDDEDFEGLNKFNWHVIKRKGRLNGKFYAWRNICLGGDKFTSEGMHRVIMNAPKGIWIDHINGDTLDNRKSNLRFCTNSQNQANSTRVRGISGFKGVYRRRDSEKWFAHIGAGKNSIYLGKFDTEMEAAQAYDRKAKELWGDFACVNLINGKPNPLISKQALQQKIRESQ